MLGIVAAQRAATVSGDGTDQRAEPARSSSAAGVPGRPAGARTAVWRRPAAAAGRSHVKGSKRPPTREDTTTHGRAHAYVVQMQQTGGRASYRATAWVHGDSSNSVVTERSCFVGRDGLTA